MKLVAFLAAAPLLVVAMPATRQATDSTDLFNVLASTRVVAGFNLNPFGAADERFWLPDTPASSTSCPSSVEDCPNVNLTIIASPSTLVWHLSSTLSLTNEIKRIDEIYRIRKSAANLST
jgi:hypothetical protein